ncbi:TnsA endonuclease N-terminal domain-containing protein [Paenibacillus glycanilyticus]|uniref:TnsA endonuclease N-terminal domain-containing protein n=1 Tax=Paenibacillus glycanilyticus TaxID=126569 RepID=A0ABQ6GIS9_9BACL|nr:TnsA endonuclease N-terminal domain-containing protein [Paenibacillus glycanilyticus]GLX70799.1 hypothetical protein MU1_51460 [Paenibacillus glycanilyticus]
MARRTSDESMVFGESLLERDFVRFCNFQPEILKIEYQPLRLKYNYKRRARSYTPDFLLTDVEGEMTIVEVKPSHEVNNPENVIKFEVAKIYCQEKGWRFKVVTELDLRKGCFSTNINLLLDVMRLEIAAQDMVIVYDQLKKVAPCSIKELRQLINEDDGIGLALFTAIVYKLLLDRYIYTDLVSQRIADQSVLYINVEKVF